MTTNTNYTNYPIGPETCIESLDSALEDLEFDWLHLTDAEIDVYMLEIAVSHRMPERQVWDRLNRHLVA